MPFVSVVSREMEGKHVIEINVSVGINRPYYIREKGLKPTSVYVRRGSSSQPVTDEGIRDNQGIPVIKGTLRGEKT